MKIAVLVTCYNRVDKTVRGLSALLAAAANAQDAAFEIFLVDDASPDDTGAIVRKHFPAVHVIAGTGSLFWNRGMCLAYARARSWGAFDAYLLFNDDVDLAADALERMVSAYRELNLSGCGVAVGAVCSPTTRQATYGGYNLGGRFRPLDFVAVPPAGALRECDTFNGNCTLVPGHAMDAVGGLDPAFHHAYGDLDLGLVLRKRGCRSFLLPDPVGYCEADPPAPVPPLGKRLIAMFAPRDPVSDRIHFTYKRYAWPLATMLAAAQLASRLFHAFHPHRAAPPQAP